MKLKSISFLLALFCLLCPLLLACGEPEPVVGEFVPPAFDPAAVVGTPEVPEGLGYGELDVKGIYKVSVCGVVRPNGNKADVFLTNPVENAVWLKLRILDAEGELLGETGLIRPGEYVQSVTLSRVPEQGSAITMRVMSYEPQTYYSAGEAKLTTKIS